MRKEGRGNQHDEKNTDRGETRHGGEREGAAVGETDKPLRDFSRALLSSIDVDSRSPRRRKAPGGCSESSATRRFPFVRSSDLSRGGHRRAPAACNAPRDFTICRYGFADTLNSRIRARNGKGKKTERRRRGSGFKGTSSVSVFRTAATTTGNKACHIANE